MISTKASQAALRKSRIDLLEYRRRELEAEIAVVRKELGQLQAEETPPSPLVPPPPAARPCLPLLKKNGQVLKKALPPPPPIIRVIKFRRMRWKGRPPTKFTPEVLASIPLWIEQGLSREQIAEKIGTTLNSLQVNCSKKGISLWAKDRGRIQQVVVVREEVA